MYDIEIKNSRVDCIGLKCPMPILQVRLALNALGPGDTVEILADDPTFQKDFMQFCQLASVSLIETTQITPTLSYYKIGVL